MFFNSLLQFIVAFHCLFQVEFQLHQDIFVLVGFMTTSPYVSQAGLALTLILLPQSLMYWDDRSLPLCLATQRFLKVLILYYIFFDML